MTVTTVPCHSFGKVPIWDKYQGPVSQNWPAPPPLIPLSIGLEKITVGLVNLNGALIFVGHVLESMQGVNTKVVSTNH